MTGSSANPDGAGLQVTSELSFERGGPDRWMSPFQLVQTFLSEHGPDAAGRSGVLRRRIRDALVGATPAVAVRRPDDRRGPGAVTGSGDR